MCLLSLSLVPHKPNGRLREVRKEKDFEIKFGGKLFLLPCFAHEDIFLKLYGLISLKQEIFMWLCDMYNISVRIK